MRVGFRRMQARRQSSIVNSADGTQVEIVLHGALEFRRVFDRDHAVVRRQYGQTVENRIDEGRLSAARRANHQDVLFRAHSGADDVHVSQATDGTCEILPPPEPVQWIAFMSQNAAGLIVGEREDTSAVGAGSRTPAAEPRATQFLRIGCHRSAVPFRESDVRG